MATVKYNLYFHFCGEVEVDDPEDEQEFLSAVFPDGWEGELMDFYTSPSFCSEGYKEVVECE